MAIYNDLKKNKLNAFTLVELLVCIAIIAIVSAISISAYPNFSTLLATTSESYKLLSFMRETQSFGSSSVNNPGQKMVYGMSVQIGKNVSRVEVINPSNNTTAYFANQNTLTDLTGLKDVFTFKKNYEVYGICADEKCKASGSSLDTVDSDVSKALILFKRPNPEAKIITLSGKSGETNVYSPNDIANPTKGHARLVVFMQDKNKKQVNKKIIILSTGQMYVQD